MNLGHVWCPDLTSIGIDAVPANAGWTTLRVGDEVVIGQQVSRKPGWGEYTLDSCITGARVARLGYESAQLVLARPVQGPMADAYSTFSKDVRHPSIVPVAIAPVEWMFGPQYEAVLRLVEFSKGCQSLVLDVDREVGALPFETLRLVDATISASSRQGAIAQAILYAERTVYDASPCRQRVAGEVIWSLGDGARSLPWYKNSAYRAWDNAIRWLVLWDVLPGEVRAIMSHAWYRVLGWQLHPDG